MLKNVFAVEKGIEYPWNRFIIVILFTSNNSNSKLFSLKLNPIGNWLKTIYKWFTVLRDEDDTEYDDDYEGIVL